MELDIVQVAKASGVPASTLRYYEERGLITSIGRQGLKRVFRESVLETLALIALGQASGFSLDEIAQLFSPAGDYELDRDLLSTKADELDRSIKQLTTMRDGLRHAAACQAPSHLECPKFRRLMGMASRGAKQARHATPALRKPESKAKAKTGSPAARRRR